jgi:hypothetical protein
MHASRTKVKKRRLARVALPIMAAVGLIAVLLPGSGAARSQAAPTNNSEPKVIGQALEGKTLTASPGSWSGTTPINYAYRWVRCPKDGGAPDGSNCGVIPNATNSSYQLRNADVGLRIRVRVTASNSDGTAIAASNPTAIVKGSARPQNTQPPTITGSPVIGQTLTGDPGTWSGTQPISYAGQWRRCNGRGGDCSNIAGATGRKYNLRQVDVGSTLRLRVTARNSVGSTTATSVPTGVVVAAAPPTGCPGGSGVVTVDQLSPPARLLVDRFQVSPNPIPLSTGSLITRFHVTACGGRAVAGALVYVTAVPYNQFTIPSEHQTGGDGWVTMQMNRLNGFPAANRQTLLVMFVRARKNGEPVVGGISSRRLISFHLSR